ncbi:glycerol-3-phosphate 1-O-acyltransferase PlsY [Corallincola luteus]|uniref:Glycerol-3-phosphate acyltransferase n=4 Tax=Psychromonadaceae TaxID=267894 RepID=A0A368NPW6_9GAMM|nr:glycerol-3-phosphate 1-O-acyltransferase PlsY [Corallincola holothuriorum]TAA47643.1 glycerol-3-phosphate 1-O-acyltransferase PlsY [Corallincola spongiicola]TCI05626.1 glycerol-3-phosphate 1-O-acyltransferase PlsY [Corallincola luteus]
MVISAYLMGSVSSAVLVCRLFGLPDPRTEGSKNPGTTNVYRLGGAVPAVLTLLADMLKGTIPVWGSYFLQLPAIWLGVIAVAACIGHMYPCFFEFSGGKGVATAFGALLPIGLDLGALLVITWGLVIRTSGYSSLASIVTISLSPLFVYWIKPLYTLPVAMLALLMLWRHHQNISRLLAGTEKKIWEKGSTSEQS